MRNMMRVGIVGGGPAGLTLAATLRREATKAAPFEITVLERGSAGRDQGNGWDLSKTAQEALARAGVDVPAVQRRGSDTARLFNVTDTARPDVCMRWPNSLAKLGLKKDQVLEMLNQETSRNEIIRRLIAAATHSDGGSGSVTVRHDCNVSTARRTNDGRGVEILGRNGDSYGTYDVVVDASGIASRLRHCRFSEAADAFYTGRTIVQGIVSSPEKSWHPWLTSRLGEGSMAVAGPAPSGTGIEQWMAQRYGAALEDQHTNINLWCFTEGPNDIPSLLKLEGLHGITSDKDAVKATMDYCVQRLSHEDWPEMYRDAFRAAESIRVLPVFMHPMAEVAYAHAVPDSEDLSVIGIGDALHALPPWSGTSGNYALTDATELATALLKLREGTEGTCTQEQIAAVLREQEAAFLKRADGPRERCMQVSKFAERAAKTLNIRDFSFEDSFLGTEAKDRSWSDLESVCIVGFFRVITFLNWLESYGIQPPKHEASAAARAAAEEPAAQ
uniref:FAD-binding domain-containing protein n=1 Tax=Chloropicon laureae TaxID=464258 RepID=A0A7S2Z600_9CHLO|mmetsp:Transcript_6278/g.16188  ORF Transcript_6278/g.16188 Transcript_6278/m.16188 type:complete len:502 (+) Transcript_6278:60-1565(+)